MAHFTKAYIAIALAILCTSGCATSGIEGSGAAVTGPLGHITFSKNVVIHNETLALGLQIVDLKLDFVGDLLRANVLIHNKYDTTLNLQYKFSWFDEEGREIDPASKAWTPIVLYGKGSKMLQSIAPNPAAEEFKINIQKL